MIRYRKTLICSSLFLIFSLLLGACASAPTTAVVQASPIPSATATLAPSATPDMCAANNIRKEIKKVYDLEQKFDDTVFVASLTSQQQLPPIILTLQDVRRQIEELDVAVCVSTLQLAAVNYQNATILYLAHFMGGSPRDQINSEMADSQNLRKIYDIEISRLLGVPYVPPATPTPLATALPTQPTAPPTPTVELPTPGGSASDIYVTNTGVIPANLRDIPSITGNVIGGLPVGARARVLFRTAIGDWLLIQYQGVPNNLAWIFTNVVTLNVDISKVPVISPSPTATATPSS